MPGQSKAKNILAFEIEMSIFAKRLKEARVKAGLSQEKLGVEAGIDEASASARMNQYERGKHEPDISMVERIAKALDLPEAFFYAKNDDLAWLIATYHRMDEEKQRLLLEATKDLG